MVYRIRVPPWQGLWWRSLRAETWLGHRGRSFCRLLLAVLTASSRRVCLVVRPCGRCRAGAVLSRFMGVRSWSRRSRVRSLSFVAHNHGRLGGHRVPWACVRGRVGRAWRLPAIVDRSFPRHDAADQSWSPRLACALAASSPVVDVGAIAFVLLEVRGRPRGCGGVVAPAGLVGGVLRGVVSNHNSYLKRLTISKVRTISKARSYIESPSPGVSRPTGTAHIR